MDPRILALIAQAAGETVAGVGGGVSKIDWLSPEQRNKMKELERQQALGLLGLDEAAQQRILSQQLQPVQALGRQATQQAQQSQLIGDVGQGAAFRQQAAQQGALQQATIDATQRGQEQIAQMDELARARQLAEMRALQKQRQKTKEGITDIVGSLAGGAAMAGHIGLAAQELDTLEKSFGVKVEEKQKKALKQMGGKTTPAFEKTFYDALQSYMLPASSSTETPTVTFESLMTDVLGKPPPSFEQQQLGYFLDPSAAVAPSVVAPALPQPYTVGESVPTSTSKTFGYKIIEAAPDGSPIQIQWFDSENPNGRPGFIFNVTNPADSQHFADLLEKGIR